MVRVDQSCSTIAVIQDTAIGIDWWFTNAFSVIHLPTILVNSRFKLSMVLSIHFLTTSFFPSRMFRFSSFLLNLTMRRLLLFLVFATRGTTSSFNEFDEWDFQRQQDTLGIVNGSHSISGAAFIREQPIVLVKALKTLWTNISFPEIAQLDPTPLNQILDQASFEPNDLDL